MGLELDSEGREARWAEGRQHQRGDREYETQAVEILTVGNNERLGQWPRPVCAWGGGRQEIKWEGEAGAGLKNLARVTEYCPVSIREPQGEEANF